MYWHLRQRRKRDPNLIPRARDPIGEVAVKVGQGLGEAHNLATEQSPLRLGWRVGIDAPGHIGKEPAIDYVLVADEEISYWKLARLAGDRLEWLMPRPV
jgi:hypothetical protein